MKIYTEINYEWIDGELAVASEKSHEYDGEIVACKGGGGGQHVEESPHAKELAKIAKEKWAIYQEKFVPVENKFMSKVESMNDPAQFDRAAGMAMNEAKMQITPTINEKRSEMMGMGVRPGSGRYVANMNEARMVAGGAAGNAGMTAGIGKKDQYVQNIENIIGIGQGQSGRATQGMADLASSAVQKSKDDAFSAWNDKQSTREIAGTGAGMGMSYWLDKQSK